MRDRLAAEITEERDAKLNVTDQGEKQTDQLLLPPFQQCSIQPKMYKSHANTAILDISMLSGFLSGGGGARALLGYAENSFLHVNQL